MTPLNVDELLEKIKELWSNHPDLNPPTRRDEAVMRAMAEVIDIQTRAVLEKVEDSLPFGWLPPF